MFFLMSERKKKNNFKKITMLCLFKIFKDKIVETVKFYKNFFYLNESRKKKSCFRFLILWS